MTNTRRLLLTMMSVCAVVGLAAARQSGAGETAPLVTSDSLQFADHGVRLANVAAAPGDTARIVARWGAAADQYGAATSYRVKWNVLPDQPGYPTTRDVSALTDAILLPLPALPDSARVRVVVWAIRNNTISADSVFARASFKRAPPVVPPPPPPGPVVLDTVVQLLVLPPVVGGQMTTGDTAPMCLAYRSAAGLTGVLSAIPDSVPLNANPALYAPNYAACRQQAEALLGALTGSDFFGVGAPGVPPCVYPRGAAPPAECLAPQQSGSLPTRAARRYATT